MEHCQLLKRMLEREAQELCTLRLEDCGLGADEWRAVCEGVAGSKGQVTFVFLLEENGTVHTDTLLPLLRAPSAVDFLGVGASNWSEGAFEELVRGLRKNERMTEFVLHSYPHFPHLHLVEELLTTYNCTLEEVALEMVDEASQGRVDALLARNKRVRALVKAERTNRHPGSAGTPDDLAAAAFERYHLSRPSVWPRVLEECGTAPHPAVPLLAARQPRRLCWPREKRCFSLRARDRDRGGQIAVGTPRHGGGGGEDEGQEAPTAPGPVPAARRRSFVAASASPSDFHRDLVLLPFPRWIARRARARGRLVWCGCATWTP
jgi:hypothetical protein